MRIMHHGHYALEQDQPVLLCSLIFLCTLHGSIIIIKEKKRKIIALN